MTLQLYAFDAPNGRRENLREPRSTICAGEPARDLLPRASAWSAEARAAALVTG